MLDILLGMTDKKISVEIDQALFRPLDTPDVICDYSKLRELTGWEPEISLETTLSDTLEYFKKVV